MPLHTQAAENERVRTRPRLLSPRAPAPLAVTMRTSTTSPAAAVGQPPYGPLEGARPPPGHVPLARRFRCGPHAARAARLPAARPALRCRAAPEAPFPAAPARCHRHRHRRRPPRFLYGGHRGAPPYGSICASRSWEATSAAGAASAPGPHRGVPAAVAAAAAVVVVVAATATATAAAAGHNPCMLPPLASHSAPLPLPCDDGTRAAEVVAAPTPAAVPAVYLSATAAATARCRSWWHPPRFLTPTAAGSPCDCLFAHACTPPAIVGGPVLPLSPPSCGLSVSC